MVSFYELNMRVYTSSKYSDKQLSSAKQQDRKCGKGSNLPQNSQVDYKFV